MFLQGSCVGQGSFSDLSNIDVQSLVGIPESADDSAVETGDQEEEEKKKDATVSIEQRPLFSLRYVVKVCAILFKAFNANCNVGILEIFL